MKIFVKGLDNAIALDCKPTDTVGLIFEKVRAKKGIPRDKLRVMFNGRDLYEMNMTLADAGIQETSTILLVSRMLGGAPGEIERQQRPEWTEEHFKVFLHLLHKLCQDGTIIDGEVTYDAWLLIQDALKSSTKNSFEIDFLKQLLRDYLCDNSEKKKIRTNPNQSKCYPGEEYKPLLGKEYEPSDDFLKELGLLLTSRESSDHKAFDTSTNMNSKNRILKMIFRNMFHQSRQILNRLVGGV